VPLRGLHWRALMGDAKRRRALAGVMLTIFLAAMESTVVATAMPTVVTTLGGIHMYSWVFSGFLLTSTVTMPLWGRLSDLFGRRRMYMVGLTIFLVGSALSGAAQNMLQLILFRMVQGVGAGSLLTIGMTIVGDLFGLERRARMQGYLSGVWGVASLIGPLLGGLFSDRLSWRWIFYINVPFGAVAMAMIGTALGADHGARKPVIDYAGLILFTAGVSSLLLALVDAGQRATWTDLEVVGPLIVAAACLIVFVVVERRAAEPIVPLRLFRNRIVLAAAVTGFLAGMAMFGAISFVPLFIQSVTGASATAAGFVLTPFVLGWIALSIGSARLVLKIGYRHVVIAGMACLTLAFLLFTRWSASLTRPVAMRDVLVGGVGMGLTMVPMLIAVQSAVARSDLGAATSMTQFFRTIGGTVGLSLMGAIMARKLAAGEPMATALHGVFVLGFLICMAAVAAAFLVPSGRAQDLARAEMRGDPRAWKDERVLETER
jgi:EmrB/QacA subfamily drug resistance transporter